LGKIKACSLPIKAKEKTRQGFLRGQVAHGIETESNIKIVSVFEY
jgi:hypothetical protein